MANEVSRRKASSHPTPPGGIYVGIVKSVTPNERVYVQIPKLGVTTGPMRVLNAEIGNPPTVGSQVLCAYTNMSNNEMYVIGSATPSPQPVVTEPELTASQIIASQVFG